MKLIIVLLFLVATNAEAVTWKLRKTDSKEGKFIVVGTDVYKFKDRAFNCQVDEPEGHDDTRLITRLLVCSKGKVTAKTLLKCDPLNGGSVLLMLENGNDSVSVQLYCDN